MTVDSIKNLYPALRLIICFSLFTAINVHGEEFKKEVTASANSWEQVYTNDFSTAIPGERPEGMFILNGEFKVVESEANRLLVLPGEPLGDFGILFGSRREDNVAVRARISSDAKGRRLPAFSIGLNGRSGYRLRVSAAAKEVQLLKGNEVSSAARFEWIPKSWIWMHLQIDKTDDDLWMITGKVWLNGSPEPMGANVQVEDNDKPPKGRASVWGMPYSGKDILFDDLSIFIKREDE